MLLHRDHMWKDIKQRYANLPQKTTKYTNLPSISKTHNGVISVHNDDTLDFPIINNVENPLILIFADDINPGGCIESGNGMQEESLFRRTGLFRYMSRNFYPLKDNETLYCENVPVIRMSEMHRSREIPEIYYSFVAGACLKYPSFPMKFDEINLMKEKVDLILKIAILRGHKNVILGAWGCGAFGCNPNEIAKILKEVCSWYNLRVYIVVLGKTYNIFENII